MKATSIEQSRKLLELGLSPETADMCYHEDDGLECVPYRCIALNDRSEYLPCWSLDALLELMKDVCLSTPGKTTIKYYCTLYDNGDRVEEFCADSALDAAYQMIIWLLERGRIKTI